MNLSSRTILIPSIVLLIGSVIGTSATNAFAYDPFKNKVNIDTDTKQKNDCDTDASGTSSEGCLASDKTTTDTIVVQGEKNKVDLTLTQRKRSIVKAKLQQPIQ